MSEPTNRASMRTSEWIAFSLVLALALVMRLYRIGTESIWFDEAITYLGLHFQNPMEFFRHEATHDPSSVPFYYGIAYIWYHLGFASVLAMRLLSVAAGMGIVAGIYFFGRKLFGHIGGLTAALCVACAKLHVYQSQEIRNYAFTSLIALFAMFALHKAAVENDKRWWPANVAANVLIAYTHLLGTVLLFGQGVYLLMSRPRQIKLIALWTLVHVPFLALIPFWIKLITTANFDHETNWIPRSYMQRATHTYFYVFAGSKMDTPDIVRELPFGTLPVPEILGVAMMAGGLAYVLTCVWFWRKGKETLPGFKPANAFFILCWLFAPPATLYLVGKIQPSFLERYVLYSSLALYLVVGGAIAALPSRAARYAAVGLLALIFAGNTVDMERPLRYDVSSAGKVLRDAYAPGEHVWSWFYNLQLPTSHYAGVPEAMFMDGGDEFAEKAVQDAEVSGRSWILFEEVPGRYEHEHVEAVIAQHPDVTSSRWRFDGRRTMYLYELDSTAGGTGETRG